MEFDNVIQKLIEKNLLTVKDDKVCIKPLNQYDFTTYPIEDEYILITGEEYVGLLTRVYMFNEELTGVIDYVEPIIEVLGNSIEETPIEEDSGENENSFEENEENSLNYQEDVL